MHLSGPGWPADKGYACPLVCEMTRLLNFILMDRVAWASGANMGGLSADCVS